VSNEIVRGGKKRRKVGRKRRGRTGYGSYLPGVQGPHHELGDSAAMASKTRGPEGKLVREKDVKHLL